MAVRKYAAYNLPFRMPQDANITHLCQGRFGTRAAAVAQEKAPKERALDATSHLQARSVAPKAACALSSGLALAQALTRRSLAITLVGVATSGVSVNWSRHLLHHLQQPPPPCYRPITHEQIFRADRVAFQVMAGKLTTLKRTAAGTVPIVVQLELMPAIPRAMFCLMPTGAGEHASKSLPAGGSRESRKRKRKSGPSTRQQHAPPPAPHPQPRPNPMAPRARDPRSFTKAPVALAARHNQSPEGERTCWTCNLPKGCPNGSACPKLACVYEAWVSPSSRARVIASAAGRWPRAQCDLQWCSALSHWWVLPLWFSLCGSFSACSQVCCRR